MSEEVLVDDQSHYEISLTAGQAFVAFVLLLLSLAASFAFGLMIGKGQADDRLVARKETSVATEASAAPKKNSGTITELGVAADDFKSPNAPKTDSAPVMTDTTPVAAAPIAETDPSPAAAGEGARRAGEGTTPVNPEVAPEAPVAKPAAEAAKPATKPAAQLAGHDGGHPAPAATPATKPAAQVAAREATHPAPAPATKPAPATPVFAQLLSTGDRNTAETLAAKVIDRGFTSAYVQRSATEKGTIYRVRVKFANEGEAKAAEGRLKEFSKDVWITR